ncbi:MAG: porin [Deltaproteobacteria bacterium]|nr:porin [Deltaproteobacteria bacterium]
MKKSLVAVIAALGACFMAAQGAEAKTLEDVLKEKGVITEADYQEVAKSSKPFEYKLGKGVTFTSADEKFQFSLGGRMQYRYTFMDYDKDSTSNDSSKFEAKRIRLIAQGYAYTKNLTYKMEIDPTELAASDGRKGLLDSFVNYKVMDELQFLVGQTKVKFGYNLMQSDATLMFVDRSTLYTAFTPSYEIGAFAYGKAFNGLVEYATSVTNGDGQTAGATSNDNCFAARISVSPLGAVSMDEPDLAISKKPVFTIGANYLYNTVDKDTTNYYNKVWAVEDTEVNSVGVDGHFKWMGLALQGEAIFLDGETEALVYYGQAGYMITPKLGVAFRYTVQDTDRHATGGLSSEQIGAVSYYFDKHNLKVQADVGNIHKQTTAGGPTDDMQYRAQVQLVF